MRRLVSTITACAFSTRCQSSREGTQRRPMNELDTQTNFQVCVAQAISLCKQYQRPCCQHQYSHISIRLHIFDHRLQAFIKILLSGHIFDHCMRRRSADGFSHPNGYSAQRQGSLRTSHEILLRRESQWRSPRTLGGWVFSSPESFKGACQEIASIVAAKTASFSHP